MRIAIMVLGALLIYLAITGRYKSFYDALRIS
jgi:hypothetical protein